MNMPIWIYVVYVIYVAYTGVYVYNRTHGRSAQFFTVRVLPTSSDGFKLFVDICTAGSFVFAIAGLIWKTFFV